MKKHVITLPNGKRVSAGKYAAAWRVIRGLDNNVMVTDFDHFPRAACKVRQEILYGLHDRINRHIPGFGAGRKWDYDYQTRLLRDSRRLIDIANRIRVYQFETAEAAARFSNLLADRSY